MPGLLVILNMLSNRHTPSDMTSTHVKQQCNRYTSNTTVHAWHTSPHQWHIIPHQSTTMTRVYTKDQSIPAHQSIPVHTSLYQWHTSQHQHTTLHQWHTSLHKDISLHQWYTSLHQWHQFTLTHRSTPVTSVHTITHQWDTSLHHLHTSLYQWHNTSHQWNTEILITNHTIWTHEETDSLTLALSGCE